MIRVKRIQLNLVGRRAEIVGDAVATALAQEVADRAIDNVTEQGAIDTGALRASIYYEAPGENGRSAAVASAAKAGSGKGRKSGRKGAPEMARPGTATSRPGEARAAAVVEYAGHVERGTKRGMRARPFMTPAAEEVRLEAEEIAAAVARKLLG